MPRSRDVTHTLQQLALERTTATAPLVFVGMLIGVVFAKHLDVPLAPAVIGWNVVALSSLAIGLVALRRGRIPAKWGHLTLAAVWGFPVVATLLSGAIGGMTQVMPMVLVEVLCTVVLIQTAHLVVALAAVDLIVLPLLYDAHESTRLLMFSMVIGQMFSVLFQWLHRNALLRAERLRLVQAQLAEQLAVQLDERQRSEIERERLSDLLLHSQRMEATGTLAAGLAHDMNNILASISTFAELLRTEVVSTVAQDDIDRIVAQAGRGGELTKALLAFSRHGQYRKCVIGADAVLREVVPILSRTLPKSIQILLRTRAGSSRIDGDATQLHQVIVNLGVNAADAMGGTGILEIDSARIELAGGEATRVGLTAGPYVLIRVSDNGCGMDVSTARRAFEPFFTTKPRDRGTGLGLSMVWGIVKNHGGTIEVTSQPGKGTMFSIYLPISTALLVVDAPSGPVKKVGQHTTVLVVDDEHGVRTSTARLLQRKGHKVLTAENGADALEIHAAHSDVIGLVILDMGMPVMGGAECFRKLREHSSVPVLIATGYAADDEAQALTADGAALLEKPFPPSMLVKEVARLLA
jgi:signal transduction histidine kinase